MNEAIEKVDAKGKHILVVSQYFYPEQFRINDLCQEWIKRGYEVTVLTGIPNYPKGKFFKGYGWFSKRSEKWNGVNIVRIPIISRGKSAFRLVLNYLSFVVSGFFWKVFTSLKADYVFIYEVSPVLQAYPGLWFAKKRNIPSFLYVMDLWPDNVQIVAGINSPFILNLLNKATNSIYRQSSKILTSSKSFKRIINERGVPKDKLVFWPQYAEDFYKPVEASELAKKLINPNHFNIVFTGNIGQAQGLSVLVKCSELLKNDNVHVCFNLIGDGRYKETLIEEIQKANVEEYFNLIDRQKAEDIPGFLGACDVALICLEANPLFEATIPAKLQSYMACGMPILVSANGEVQEIVNDANCGWCANAGDHLLLKESILELIECRLIKAYSRQSLNYCRQHFAIEKILSDFDLIIKTIIKYSKNIY